MDGYVNLVYHFAIPQGMLPWQTKVQKVAFFTDQFSLICCHSKTDCNIAFPISNRLNGMNFSALCRILVTFSLVTPEFTLLRITLVAAIQQKSAYYTKYPRISWTYLDLLYRFGRHIGGDDYPNICLAVAQGTLLSQPV